MSNSRLPLIAIVGPTASGKSSLAIKLAKKYNGEIICADSRTIYKGMNIGTAKPSSQEQAEVPHWGLDLVEPGQPYSAADFQHYAKQKIAEIRARSHVPFLVGGTGLYIDALLYDYSFGPPADLGLRQELEAKSLKQLHDYCFRNNIILPVDAANKRHLIRAIELRNISGIGKNPIANDSFVVAIATDKKILEQRIAERTEHMFENAVVQEATMLGEKYGWDSAAMSGNAYPIIELYLLGELTLHGAIARITTLDRQLAKRQMTWFRRNPDIMWAQLTEAEGYIVQLLATG